MTNFEKVGEFRNKFNLMVSNYKTPGIIANTDFLFRLQLIMEETNELLAAHRRRNIVDFADALADLLYVTYGLAHEAGIPMDRVFAEVHRANMEKVRATGDDDPLGKRGSASDVVKPPGWAPPDVRGALDGTL